MRGCGVHHVALVGVLTLEQNIQYEARQHEVQRDEKVNHWVAK